MAPSEGLTAESSGKRTVIIFTANSGLKGTLRDEIKAFGVTAPELVDSPDACMKALAADLKAWLLMDVSSGAEKVASILVAARKGPEFPARPIYLVASEVSSALASIALENSVTKIRVGRLSATEVRNDLQQLGEFAALEAQVAHVMTDVQKLSKDGQWGAVVELIRSEQGVCSTHMGLKVAEVDALINTDDFDGAIKVAAAICASYPDNLRGAYTLARVYMKQGKFDEAAAILTKAEANQALNPERLVALGDCYLETGQFKKARAKYNSAMGLDPASKGAKSGQAKSSLLLGDLDAGLRLAREIGDAVDLAKLLNTTGVIASRGKKFDLAHQIYGQGIALLESQAKLASRLWYNQGICFYRSGNQEKAVSCFDSASKLDPDFTHARQNSEKLRRQRVKGDSDANSGVAKLGMSLDEFEEATVSDFVEEGFPDL